MSGAGFEPGLAEQETALAQRLDLTGSNLLAADLSKLEGILTESTITPAYGGNATDLPTDVALPTHWMVGEVGVVGGGTIVVPEPPWNTRTRQQMDATNATLDTNSLAYVVDVGWRDWLEGIPTEQHYSYWCDRHFADNSEAARNVLDAFQINYQGVEIYVDRILSPDWYSVLDDAFP